jgi:glycolate oxidase subunit GlcD
MLSDKIKRKLRKIVGKGNVLSNEAEMRVYQYDASLDMALPDAVLLPSDAQQVSKIVYLAAQEGIPYLPRGSGTNLSGGSIPIHGGIIIEFSRMNRILEVDRENHRVLVEPGVYNLELQDALAREGFFYPPDPASQRVSTLGGNIGENSGGPHCLKYGVTTNHVLGLEAVLPSGQIIEVGGHVLQQPGYDLVGLMVGSEGTLAMVTKAWLRILPLPEIVVGLLTVFDSLNDAARAVTAIIRTGIIPAAMEMMDRPIINAVEDSVQAGYPRDAEAVLIIDVDGPQEEVHAQVETISEICTRHHAREVRIAAGDEERDNLWSGRRGAFGAVARITPNYLVTDCTVPRTELPGILGKVAEVSREVGLPIGNVFHAGDGNLHPLILFDDRNAEERERAHAAGKEIMEICAAVGGTISGEHGIGLEKKEAMPLIFSRADIGVMRKVKGAFDPNGSLNPGKIFPDNNLEEEFHSNHHRSLSPELEVELIDLLGAERAIVPEEGSECHKVGSIVPRVVVYPETEEEVCEIVRVAAACGAALVPKGGGSKALRMGIPERADIILSLEGLNGIKELDVENFVVTLQAGMGYSCLQKTLHAQGLALPVSPFYASRATLGGVAATSDNGFPNPHLTALRDIVLGMSVIMADGLRVHFGGVTMKNVAGYDMCKLFLGSYGTLGIITDMTLRLKPFPESEAAVWCATDDPFQALTCCAKFSEVCDLDSTVQLLNPESARQMFSQAGLDEEARELSCPDRWTLIVHCSGRSSQLDARIRRHKTLLGELKTGMPRVVTGDEARALRLALSDFFEAEEGTSLGIQISTPITRVEEVIDTTISLARSHRQRIKMACAPGCGSTCVVFMPEEGDISKEKMHKLAVDATTRYKSLGCNYHLENAPLNLLGLIEPWHNHSHSLTVMTRLKRTLDPHNLLNPGKLINLD